MKFPRKEVPFYWASARGIHPLVAEGIWSIASEHRTAMQIWMNPTDHEKEQVAGAIHQFRLEDARNGYAWCPKRDPIKPKSCSYVEPKPEEKKDERKPRAPRKRSRAAAAPGKRAAKGRS